MSWREPHQVQQGAVATPAPGEEQPQALGHAGGQPAGKQLCRKGAGGPGGHQVKHEAAIAAKVANSILGCIRQSVASRSRQVTLSKTSPGEVHLGCWVQHEKDIDLQ